MTHEERKQLAKFNAPREGNITLQPDEEEILSHWLAILNETGISYLVGGAFAIHEFTSIWRFTKDLDIFVKPQDVKTVLDALSRAGYNTEVRDRYWLAKVHHGEYFMDIIFTLGNGYIPVHETWFGRSHPMRIAGVATRLIAVEELIASKIYVTRRDRFDGADILHVIRGVQGKVNWKRIEQILGGDRLLLLWYLILFQYVYPGHAHYLPQQLMTEIFEEVKSGWAEKHHPKSFCGIMIDPLCFSVDVLDWGYTDSRKSFTAPINDEGEKV